MARSRQLGIKNGDDIKSIISLEGRPVSLTVSLESDGTLAANDGGTPPIYSAISAGEIGIDVGRAVWVKSITISSSEKGRISGVLAQDAQNQWIGSGNQDSYDIAVADGSANLDFDGLILGSGSRVTLTFTPYPVSGQTQPDLGLHINGIEFTADFNFGADKRLLYCGDSISWSLLGNWKPQDLGYNYSGNRREDSLPFPNYFGDELAAFRLVNALRKKSTPESIRLVNKGFGGSRLSSDQWFAMRSGLYNSVPWSLMVMQAGINDATDVQTPLRQLTMGQRIDDMVAKRDNDGLSDYPMVFCTPPIADDKYDGLDSRVCLDVRPPLNTGESYTASFDSTSVSTIALGTPSGDRWYEVTGDGTNDLNITGGEADGVYRLDFITDNTLLTGVALSNPLNTNAFIRTWESQLNVDESPITDAGTLDVDAGTVLYIRCVTPDEEYEEVDRVKLIGSVLADDATTFDAEDSTVSHFITGTNSAATEIVAPLIDLNNNNTGISDAVPIVNALSSRNITQFNLGAGSGLFAENIPSSAQIDSNDVWVRVTGMTNAAVGAGDESWSDVNGFYKVVNYNLSGNNIQSIQVMLDTRDSAGRVFSDGAGATNYNASSGTLQLFNCRPYIAQFEGNTNNTTSNCSFFENGDNVVGDFTIKVQMKEDTPSPYNLTYDATTGKVKAICFSVYQQGNVIFMNEIASGDVIPSGKVVGGATTSGFWGQTEVGKTRLQTVRETITTTVNSFSDSANVHLVDLYDIDDLAAGNIGTGDTPATTETTGGRLIYGDANYKADTSGGAASRLLINDLIEDPIFKATGDSGTNERVMGQRLHRSPRGHEEIFNRLWAVIEDLTIPN